MRQRYVIKRADRIGEIVGVGTGNPPELSDDRYEVEVVADEDAPAELRSDMARGRVRQRWQRRGRRTVRWEES